MNKKDMEIFSGFMEQLSSGEYTLVKTIEYRELKNIQKQYEELGKVIESFMDVEEVKE